MAIALKESRETKYWLDLLVKSDYLTKNQVKNLDLLLEEITKILVKIVKNAK